MIAMAIIVFALIIVISSLPPVIRPFAVSLSGTWCEAQDYNKGVRLAATSRAQHRLQDTASTTSGSKARLEARILRGSRPLVFWSAGVSEASAPRNAMQRHAEARTPVLSLWLYKSKLFPEKVFEGLVLSLASQMWLTLLECFGSNVTQQPKAMDNSSEGECPHKVRPNSAASRSPSKGLRAAPRKGHPEPKILKISALKGPLSPARSLSPKPPTLNSRQRRTDSGVPEALPRLRRAFRVQGQAAGSLGPLSLKP